MPADPPVPKPTQSDPAAALQWAIIARQKELSQGSGAVPIDVLDKDPIWLALVALTREYPRHGELIEREWTDKAGTHYEARIICRNGMVVSQVVTKLPNFGWTRERQQAAANVRREAARHG